MPLCFIHGCPLRECGGCTLKPPPTSDFEGSDFISPTARRSRVFMKQRHREVQPSHRRSDAGSRAVSMKQNVVMTSPRHRGEKFVIALPNTTLRLAITVADHIRRAVMAKELMKRSSGERLGRVTVPHRLCAVAYRRHLAVADRARRQLPLRRQAPGA